MEYQSFSPRQKLTMLWWNLNEFRERDGLICDGSVRSGKTLSMTVGFFLWSMATFDRRRLGLCGKTIEALRRNVTSEAPQWLEGIFRFEEHRSENRITVTGCGHRNEYHLFGGKDESSYMLIQGMTLAGVLFDEVALMPRSFVEQALARCSVAGSKFWFNCNPAGPEHWFFREWICKREQKNMLYLHFTMEDNPALSPSIRARYEGLYTGVFYDRYVRGLWVAAEGLIYDMFQPEKHLLSREPECAGDWYVSVDYGTRNPTVFLLWQRERDRERWICRREYYWDGRRRMRQKTDGEYADDLAELLAGAVPRAVVVDPSAASFITELRQRGWPVLPGDNRVADGIRAVGQLLREEKLAFQAGCVHTAEEFRAYVWDEGAAAQGLDKPVKDHDHCMDAVRYFVTTVVMRSSARARRRPRGL